MHMSIHESFRLSRDVCLWMQRVVLKKFISLVSKETYYSVKRDPLLCQD